MWSLNPPVWYVCTFWDSWYSGSSSGKINSRIWIASGLYQFYISVNLLAVMLDAKGRSNCPVPPLFLQNSQRLDSKGCVPCSRASPPSPLPGSLPIETADMWGRRSLREDYAHFLSIDTPQNWVCFTLLAPMEAVIKCPDFIIGRFSLLSWIVNTELLKQFLNYWSLVFLRKACLCPDCQRPQATISG